MDKPIYHLENILREKQDQAADFTGPLDLILHLLSKHKIEIRDISVSQILDQYLDWVAKRQELDLDVASEFIAMAAHLLYIKTRMLLSAQDEEALSEMEELMASLEARQRSENYQRIQQGLAAMESLYERGKAYLTRPPEKRPSYKDLALSHVPGELIFAILEMERRSRRSLPPPITALREIVGGRAPYPVERKVTQILRRIKREGYIQFSGLFYECQSRSEMVAVFIAVLELCRRGRLSLVEGEDDLKLTAGRGPNPGREEAEDGIS